MSKEQLQTQIATAKGQVDALEAQLLILLEDEAKTAIVPHLSNLNSNLRATCYFNKNQLYILVGGVNVITDEIRKTGRNVLSLDDVTLTAQGSSLEITAHPTALKDFITEYGLNVDMTQAEDSQKRNEEKAQELQQQLTTIAKLALDQKDVLAIINKH